MTRAATTETASSNRVVEVAGRPAMGAYATEIISVVSSDLGKTI